VRAWRVFHGGNIFFCTGITLGGSAPETWFQYWNLKNLDGEPSDGALRF
jgi:hypothetical protein